MNHWKAAVCGVGLVVGSAIALGSGSNASEVKQIQCFSHKARSQYNDPPNDKLAEMYAQGWRLISNALGAGPQGVFAVYCLEK